MRVEGQGKMREDSNIQRAEAFLNSSEESANPSEQTMQDDQGQTSDPADVSPERLTHVNKLGEAITDSLRSIFDPEIPVNIYDLGLIYKIDVHDDDTTTVEMTLTSPHCPVAEILPVEVEEKVNSVEGVNGCEVKIVWDPPWHPHMMSEDAQLELGMIY